MTPSDRFRARVARLPPRPGTVRAQRGAVAEIVLDAPDRRNALSAQMMIELHDAAVQVSGASVLLLRGEGDAFCAGGDLFAIRAHLTAPGVGVELQDFMAATLSAIENAAPVVVAAVTGPALGGGAELLSCCHTVFASPAASVGWVQARLGLSPGFGGGERLVRRLGRARALRLLLEARVLPAEEARQAGLVDEIVDDPVAAARAWGEAVAALPREVVAAAVALAHEGAEAERTAFAKLWGGPAHLAALDQSRAGRRP